MQKEEGRAGLHVNGQLHGPIDCFRGKRRITIWYVRNYYRFQDTERIFTNSSSQFPVWSSQHNASGDSRLTTVCNPATRKQEDRSCPAHPQQD
jgi:hypothetical protein